MMKFLIIPLMGAVIVALWCGYNIRKDRYDYGDDWLGL